MNTKELFEKHTSYVTYRPNCRMMTEKGFTNAVAEIICNDDDLSSPTPRSIMSLADECTKIEKIKSIKPNFSDGSGPDEVVTIGIKCGNKTYIFGQVYCGPHMLEEQGKWLDDTEKIIDMICQASL